MFTNLKEILKTPLSFPAINKENYERFIVANPPMKRELRPDFPNAFHLYGRMDPFIEFINEKSLTQPLKTIYIAYPQKHPEMFPSANDFNTDHVRDTQEFLKEQCPRVNWRIADSIVETVDLDRSSDTGSLHALRGKQIYGLYKEKDSRSLFSSENPFVTFRGKPSNPYFIVFDHMMDQGTTLSNMTSFLEHNGGNVLAVGSYGEEALVQQDTRSKYPDTHLSGEFANPLRNTGRLPELANSFYCSVSAAYIEYDTPQKCMEIFERALNDIGHSVFALTDSECIKLNRNIQQELIPFRHLIMELHSTP